MRILALSLVLGWAIAAPANAGNGCMLPSACTEVQTCGAADCCGHCGCKRQCEKQCRVVCEMKEVKKTVWVVKCEDFCTMMPNCCHKSGCGCGECGACDTGETCAKADCGCGNCGKKCDPCASESKKCYIPPKCGKVRTKKTLEKKEVVCKVPSYKCIVVYSCPDCNPTPACDGLQTPPAPEKGAPPAPAPSKTTQETPTLPMVGVASVEG